MANIWHEDDHVILLGKTGIFADWLFAYIDEMSYEEDNSFSKVNINWYVLSDDMEHVSSNTNDNLTLADFGVKLISNSEWVKLTQTADKVITLS